MQRLRDDVARVQFVEIALLRENHRRIERARTAGSAVRHEVNERILRGLAFEIGACWGLPSRKHGALRRREISLHIRNLSSRLRQIGKFRGRRDWVANQQQLLGPSRRLVRRRRPPEERICICYSCLLNPVVKPLWGIKKRLEIQPVKSAIRQNDYTRTRWYQLLCWTDQYFVQLLSIFVRSVQHIPWSQQRLSISF